MGLFKFIGKSLNDMTGVSTSARQQYENQLKLQKDAQEFSKWQMQNAHQMEVQDLKEAGLNPVLSAGAGGGASAGVSMGSASAGTSADPMAMIGQIINMSNSVKQTEATIKKAEADTIKALADAGYTKKEIENYETKIENVKANTAKQNAESIKIDKDTAYGGKTANTIKKWKEALF